MPVDSEEELRDVERVVLEQEKFIERLESLLLFSGEHDDRDAVLVIQSGAGGVDAQDWAEMLLRMYLRHAQRRGFKATILDENRGQEAGIKSATIKIEGSYAYGNLASEHGVHRLVRLSPYNANNLRQTSFARVEVLPLLDESESIEMREADFRVDVFRSSGAGGQSVNTTDSAVRITHIPSGIVVTCQNERSQMQNRAQAMAILRSRLYQKQREEQERQQKELRGEHISAQWGNQIRSYVIHPYKMVKDHRTNFETSNTEVFLDGDLDACAQAYLRWRRDHLHGE